MRAFPFVLTGFGFALLGGAAAGEDPAPRLRAGALSDALHVDAVLDEPAWAAAPPIEGFTMVEPTQGGTPTGRTSVRVLAGQKAVAIGIRCDDPDAAHIVSFTKERDGELAAEDHIAIVLDTFRDGRSGYVFAVNPGGARFDALISRGGEDQNSTGMESGRQPPGVTIEAGASRS